MDTVEWLAASLEQARRGRSRPALLAGKVDPAPANAIGCV